MTKPESNRLSSHRDGLRRFVKWLAHPFRKDSLRFIELLTILLAVVALSYELQAQRDERQARRVERMTQAVQLLSLPGSVGKTWALEALSEQGVRLDHLELLPPSLAEHWKGVLPDQRDFKSWLDADGDCQELTNVRYASIPGIKLQDGILPCMDLFGSDLTDSRMWGVDLRGGQMWCVLLDFAELMDAQLQGARLNFAQLKGAEMGDADLSGAWLWNADLRGAMGLDCEQIQKANNWEMAHRDEALACGAPIPSPPDEANITTNCARAIWMPQTSRTSRRAASDSH